ncbi:Tex family protein [Shimazuella alba]|uniref:S1 RNA-binding domain-containing protein n=1 Tax=Shimazuella alba TaxID=2690964 RepID=A0A6I4VQK4_9BACL|nr:Tex family protein [Shimazuella alba]MXQ52671.1 S1 RNA-binding domain-containing protein [Shimazuella alba]
MEVMELVEQVARELSFRVEQVKVTMELIEAGNTIPFIARYRKEMTGELDEEQLRQIEERYRYIAGLYTRRDEIIRLIDEHGKLTDELHEKLLKAKKLQELEDLYLPFRPKRKTRASMAREKGLEPLAKMILESKETTDKEQLAAPYVLEEKNVKSTEEAIKGALDILAEELSEDADTRKWVRTYTWNQGVLEAKAVDADETSVYEMYYDYQEPIRTMPSHRVLAVRRAEREGILKLKINVQEDEVFSLLRKWFPHENTYTASIMQDSYKRLIAPSIDREIHAKMLVDAEEKAIDIFKENLRHLLLQSPIAGKVVLGVDPAYRTGCKLAVVDDTGKLLDIDVIYPTKPNERTEEAKEKVHALLKKYPISLIAIGNGTASRETEDFIAEVIQEANKELFYVIVNEAGASVYSASPLAKEEFPDLDAARRSAVSIARRLQDPLAELVKIDPKSVGVGQYQHDVNQKKLSESLTQVVESSVNYVGVDVNTASPSLLQYISGVSKTVAKNIVAEREKIGKYTNREQLKKVPKLGAKTFEQCIGFLRIREGDNPLDKTPIHPESYQIATQLLEKLDISAYDLGLEEAKEKLKKVDIVKVAAELNSGVPTMRDIIDSLLRPGRDPRESLPSPILRSDVLKSDDLETGMHLKGTIRNVVAFGAFVDIGLKNDALVHISKLSRQYVRNPMDVVTVGDIVDVWVLSVDKDRDRVSLSMVN